MVRISAALVSLVALVASTQASPLQFSKRIAQTTIDSVQKWESACTAAGGAQQCNPIAVSAAATLLAAAGPCDQQNSGDTMVNLAKQLNNDANMIKFAQIFVQQPRNTPTSQSVPYCQQAPKNAELNGLFQCQFQGADKTTFVGGVKVGAPGTIPFGQNAPLNPAGSCPANPTGPIADGTQLVDQVSSPGTPAAASSGSGAASNAGSGAANNAGSGAANNAGSGAQSAGSDCSGTATVTVAASAATAAAASNANSGSASASGFKLQNGKDAQALNAQFATLSASSSCTDGEDACVNGSFAQCVGGKFTFTACAGGTTCAALPLVNKAGTSITCTTQADAAARIAATGATGGIDGSGNGAAAPAAPAAAAATPAANAAASAQPASGASAAASSSGFKLQNGKDAQALNAQFKSLTASSSCTDGQDACVNGGFAQCVGGKFEITQCAGGTTCAALPLVNKAGTSITCTTEADAAARIAATGATGGIDGS